ncbi:leukocyte elastase inhibitor-like [Dermacentor silvarum]|uniref:leukocyte elastase inhibitor-like n=1 Tax=Dermacentor silvarum TaxID=543639 RepID=UPI0018983D2A|nr:leukocyte elastase inhibitor-like [Dermacentor silvarum]
MGQKTSRQASDRVPESTPAGEHSPVRRQAGGGSSATPTADALIYEDVSQSSSGWATPDIESRSDIAVSRSLLQFSIDLLREMRRSASAGANVVLSPYAVASALHELLVGSRGETAAQIATVLHVAAGEMVTHYFTERDSGIPHRRRSEPQLRFDMGYVNSVHHDRSVGRTVGAQALGGMVIGERLERFSWDFVHAPEQSCEEIDQYASLYTRAFEHEEVMAKGCITTSTRVCLLSAVDFRGSWRYAFDDRSATREPFSEADGTTSAVIMVHQKGHFPFAKCPELKATALLLPYQAPGGGAGGKASGPTTPQDGSSPPTHEAQHGPEFSLVIFLPDEHNGLESVEANLSPVTALQCLGELRPRREISVSLPLFKVKQVMELAPVLSALGVRDVFSDRALLWGSKAGEKRVSMMRHAAAFETARTGGRHQSRTTMQAGQLGAALVQGLTSLVKTQQHEDEFVVNRPFLFFLICTNPDTLILLGSVRKITW